jgi:predicted lysophospholipase L1 biosynthesis ABC-type transport system permease subunit
MLEAAHRVEPEVGSADRQVAITHATATHDQPLASEHSNLELPSWIWMAMFACYALFFAALAVATGRDLGALFMIVVSCAYTIMYFATAAVLVGLNAKRPSQNGHRGQPGLDTLTGPMTISAVVGQVLVIPICLVLFGSAIAVIRAFVE